MASLTPILQVVGYKNSGKTTLIQKLLKELSSQQLKIGVLKHHGHGGAPKVADEGTDTWKFRKSGAAVTAVEGDYTFQLTVEGLVDMSVEQMIVVLQLFSLDGLLLEGFKNEKFPKIVIIRNSSDKYLIETLSNILTIVTWDKKMISDYPEYPIFHIDEEKKYISFISKQFKGVQ